MIFVLGNESSDNTPISRKEACYLTSTVRIPFKNKKAKETKGCAKNVFGLFMFSKHFIDATYLGTKTRILVLIANCSHH